MEKLNYSLLNEGTSTVFTVTIANKVQNTNEWT